MNRVYDFIKSCDTYYLATVDSNGQPHVRPFGTINIFESKLYIQTAKKKEVSKQIQANPKVELCCYKDSVWCRVAGELVRDDRIEAKASLLKNYPQLKFMYTAEDDNTEVLYFKNATATFYNFTTEPLVVKF